MNQRWKLGGAVLVAAVVAGLLPGVSASAAAPRGVEPAGSRTAQSRAVTLITGDQVTVPQAGKNVAIRRGAGRTTVTFATQRSGEHLYVIPSDALPLLRAGRLDRRLFDVNMLLKFGYDDRRADVPLIVTYSDGATAKSAAPPSSARVTRSLPSARAKAMRVDKRDAATFWRGMTGGGAAPKTLSAGANKLWLDGLRQPTLDESVPQIGAPAAWQAGFTGTGVSVAVLDTGIDATHPDLADRVTAQKNFTEDPDDRDVVGHGTHVASTVAGSGTASNGRYKGVATGAKLLDGKVCEGFGCTESAILAGMEWGAQNAKVINMSLGGGDTPEVDPLEEAVNTLTAQHGTLFVISAGNSGPSGGTVGSPGSADAALTVGAVDKSDALADFSSRGPRVGDGAIKPDITAPGVDITAARGKDGEFGSPGESYTELSGTSMSSPHTAGAAAILAQQHPTWTPQQLKSALMGSAKLGADAGVFEQGAGRVDLTKAITAQVISTPASISFGRQEWPHGDDTPVSKTIGYHNFGSTPVTLSLAVTATGPGGAAAPAGMFSLSASTLTVPAGGDASVTASATTSTPSPDGTYGGYVTATAGTATVRTPFAVDKEVESYNVTLNHKTRTGQGATDFLSVLWNPDRVVDVFGGDSRVTLRVPKGRYLLASIVLGNNPAVTEITQFVQPVLNVTKNQAVALDARVAKPVSLTAPKPTIEPYFVDVGFLAFRGDAGIGFGMSAFDDDGLYTAQLGNNKPLAGLVSTVAAIMGEPGADRTFQNSKSAYNLLWYEKGRFFTGFSRTVSNHNLATVRQSFAKNAEHGSGDKISFADPGVPVAYFTSPLAFGLPFSRTEYFNTDGGLKWSSQFFESIPDPEFPFPLTVSDQSKPQVTYVAGKRYTEHWNRAVLGPVFHKSRIYPDQWVSRLGNTISVDAPLFGDAGGHIGNSAVDSGSITLFRNGKKIGETDHPYYSTFEVPAGKARYRLQMKADRGTLFTRSTRLDTSWTFASGHVAGDDWAELPLSVVRFAPPVDLNNSAPAGKKIKLPITVQRQPGATVRTTKNLTLEVSYDDGATWKTLKAVRNGESWTAEFTHPTKAGFVSLRAKATDTAGNTVDQTIIRAYGIAAGG